MIKARMFVVNEDTRKEAVKTCIASFSVPKLTKDKKVTDEATKQFVSSTGSMLADILQLKIGDYFFFWCERKDQSTKSCIYGVYRIISEPFFAYKNKGKDDKPFKIYFEEAYHFKNPITEYELLNSPYIKSNLWNIRGKKTSGKSRGSTPISIEETKILIDMLIEKNKNYYFIPFNRNNVKDKIIYNGEEQKPLGIDYSLRGKKLARPKTIYKYNMYDFKHFSNSGKLYYEKSLESMFNYEINRLNDGFISQLDINVKNIIWNANYLPYSLDNTEMDYLIIESFDQVSYSKIYVIEFHNDPIDEDHYYRCLLYAKWINENLCSGSPNCQPILICEKAPDFEDENNNDVKKYLKIENDFKLKYKVKNPKVYEYDFSETTPKFIRKK